MAFLKKFSPKKKNTDESTSGPAVERGQTRTAAHETIGILRYPHITEKTSALARNRAYAFAVAMRANKHQVKRAIEGRYGVKVLEVRMINVRGKEVRRGRQIGRRPGMKKAYITLAEGQVIENL